MSLLMFLVSFELPLLLSPVQKPISKDTLLSITSRGDIDQVIPSLLVTLCCCCNQCSKDQITMAVHV